MWGKKTAPNYFCDNCVKSQSILANVYFKKFPIICVFHILYKLENMEPV